MRQYTWKNKVTVCPDQIEVNDAFATKVVAAAGYNNDWAAYQGPCDWSDEQVAESGDKILREAAERLFYCMTMSGRRYRD